MNQDNSSIVCPDCGAVIPKLEAMIPGDIVECPECGTEVEITSLSPLTYRELVEEK